MRIIKCLTKQMCEEIESAKDYAICALEYRESEPDMASFYHRAAETEYGHAQELHGYAVAKIDSIKEKGVKIPSFMLNAWNEKHDKLEKMGEEAKMFIDLW